MPIGDRTGPRGLGPKTGRGVGYCTGFRSPGYQNCTPEERFDISRAGGGRDAFGVRDGYGVYKHPFTEYVTKPFVSNREKNTEISLKDEMYSLQCHVEAMKKDISDLQRRLQTLHTENTGE